jgi:hypothetical protein
VWPLCCRAGELSAQELEQLMVIVSNPRTFKVRVSQDAQ